jgi:DivIVA domain-containing protein
MPLSLAKQKHIAEERPRLTAADIHEVSFSWSPIGQQGYNQDEVDAFLDLVESELRRLDGTAEQVDAGQQARFPPPPVGWPNASPTPVVRSGRSANAGSKTGRGPRSIGMKRLLFVMVCVVLGLYLIADRARDFYGYQAGTPATATSIECSSEQTRDAAGAANTRCIGTWSVGGQSQAGPIEPVPPVRKC